MFGQPLAALGQGPGDGRCTSLMRPIGTAAEQGIGEPAEPGLAGFPIPQMLQKGIQNWP